MPEPEKINVAIVDDNKEYLESLLDHLEVFPEVEVCGTATQYLQARDLLLNEELDLVFLDIEMPNKSGFELLNEVRKKGSSFSVIFYTVYDKYVVQALRESAFDYLLKPIDSEELENALTRFKTQRAEQTPATSFPLYQGMIGSPEMIALPTQMGLQFIDKNRILLFRRISGTLLKKSSWEALLIDQTIIKLGANTSADRIVELMKKDRFLQINQSCIINLAYMSMVEYKSRSCLLVPPFDTMELAISRKQLGVLKETYEVF